ncbi:MAG: ppsE [Mucilaginibacter sp.]|nr:ppsE [Mucilaginibacter sp.]
MGNIINKASVENSGFLIHQLFEQQKNRTPEATAVVFGDEKLTYSQLDKKATALANAIYASSPASSIAAVSTIRSIETIVSVLAVLKAGKAYLPLDAEYPADRLQQIITDSEIDLCLTATAQKALFESLSIKVLVADKEHKPDGEAIATSKSVCYVLYTSGSTGTPKGVSMGHAALANLLSWQQKNSISATGVNTLQFAPLSFDVSFQEIFSTLTTGGTLVLVDDDLRIDPYRLLRYISQNSVNRIFLPFVVLQYLTEAAAAENYFPACLKEVMTAGEQLKITPQIVRFFSELPECVLFNQYGPTETHVVTELKLDGDPSKWPALPSIGVPIDHTEIFILDEALNKLPFGETGELCVSGLSLADGYLNRPEMTAEKFIDWKETEDKTTRIYRTGDLARYLPDGNIEYLGRRDTQVKIRGNRVELGEIEVLINQLNDIQQAIVIAREDIVGQKRLVAYLVSTKNNPDTDHVRKHIEQHLPDFMHPSAYVWLNELPKTTSGKVDRKNLPKPDQQRPELDVLYKAPATRNEKNIAGIWAELLLIDKIGVDDTFFHLGGNSLLALKTVSELKHRFGYEVPITKLYQFPTVGGIANLIGGVNKSAVKTIKKNKTNTGNREVAIIGMSGRFPSANTIEEFWNLLTEGKEAISFFTNNELDPSISSDLKNDPAYVKARGLIDKADEFDAEFFGFNPRSAELMDPQQRIFLEIAWEVLESSGYLPHKYAGAVGVFAGCGYNTYFTNNVLAHPDLVEKTGQFNTRLLNEKDYIATRTAYQLNLKGPAVAVYSACSTSLLAIAQAVSSIRDGQCEIALAGAASITSPLKSGHLYEEGSIMSKDGHCRPFDAAATGTVFSDGAGVVLLKNLEDAKRDGDTIYAVIKGIGINNDGADKSSFGGPSAQGQAGVITMAMQDAGIDASSISYIEAHGTATPLGDPIEMEGLTIAFGVQKQKQFCAIGSVKSNIGHLTAASGVAGLIKTVLSLKHQQIPPSLFYNKLNPNINLDESPFYVNDKLNDWKSEEKRYAGVSSFGVGGTNVHVILEEYVSVPVLSGVSKPLSLITWSAKTGTSLANYAKKLAGFIEDNKNINIADIAFTLQNTTADFNSRRFIIAGDSSDLLSKLIAENQDGSSSKKLTAKASEIVFMFPGQGSQYVNMGRDLYDNEPVFAAAVNECIALLKDTLHANILDVIYSSVNDETSAEKIKNTFYTQPAIFIIEYAMAKLWISWGIQPTILIGHSIGEFVAAHFAGVFNLNDALYLICTRAKLVSDVAGGSMLSVRCEAGQLATILPENVSIAAINSNRLCVVAGSDDAIAAFAAYLEEIEIPGRLLQTSHAFHSAMMDNIIAPFETAVKTIKLNPPVKPLVSTVTGKWMSEAEATSPAYWADHLRKTVRFADAIDTLQEEDGRFLLEVGPGNALATLSRQQISIKSTPIASGLEENETHTGYYSVLKALGQLWLNGIDPAWAAFYQNQQRIKLNLPAYAFDKKRYWLDAAISQNAVTTTFEIPALTIKTEHKPFDNALMRQELLTEKLKKLFEDTSGIEIDAATDNMNFIEIGFDSLSLTQIATNLKKEFNVPITFRKLFEEYNTIQLLAAYLDANLPAEVYKPQAVPVMKNYQQPVYNSPAIPAPVPSNNPALDLMSLQIQMLASQLALMQNANVPQLQVVVPAAPVAATAASAIHYDLTPEEQVEIKKPFGATARIEKQVQGLTEKQQSFLNKLTLRYNSKTKGSKEYTQKHRSYMADPRVVSGFRPLTKEIVYPIVVNRSKGSRVWDIDGNEYIDALNGFGSSFLGYQPEVVKEAVKEQVENGYEIGPQHELAGDVCKLICEFTDFDRSALCNTGSEAVLGAMRIARTVTGRSLIVAFSGSYHGINDEVIVRGTKKLKTIPAAPGIMPEVVQNMLILDYGTDESLRIIQERAHELAAVLVEPVQSRRPEYQPVEFLKKVRQITQSANTVLIFDEVISGFRMHPGGAQAMFGVKADLGTYGKVIGGGMPIGAIAGVKQYMDALDGGFWEYGDNSQPEAGVTYFAGTFVRHPLALAAAKASLLYMKEKGPALQQGLNNLTQYLATELNTICENEGLPLFIPSFGSLWKIKFKEELPYGELLFTLMRAKGIHIWDLFPCFLTEAHTKADVDTIIAKFRESVDELIESGFFPSNGKTNTTKSPLNPLMESPFPGARLGRDKDGNPGWFISDDNNPGKYLQVKLNGN